jgi:phosphodiesterase/alkaline phosphatase D-like protein
MAVGDGSAVYGDDMTFTTAVLADAMPPVISLVNVTDIASTGATITWITNEAATSLVEFGLSEEYGSKATPGPSAVNSHSVHLAELEPGRTYHYRVICTDDSNNRAVSADGTFSTIGISREMPAWAWAPIGLVVVGLLGGTAYSINARTASLKKSRTL